jgi:hypothetical protein
VLVLSIVAPATAAAAPAVSPAPNGCLRYIKPYSNVPAVQSFGVNAGGWAPGAALKFLVGGQPVGTGTADGVGSYASGMTLTPPKPPKGTNIFSTTLRAEDGLGAVSEVPIKVVRLGVAVPAHARPSQRVRYRAFGFSPKRKIYLFVRRNDKTKGRWVLGRPQGECGTLSKPLRYMPLKRYKVGTYVFAFTQTPRYSPDQLLASYTLTLSYK